LPMPKHSVYVMACSIVMVILIGDVSPELQSQTHVLMSSHKSVAPLHTNGCLMLRSPSIPEHPLRLGHLKQKYMQFLVINYMRTFDVMMSYISVACC
jgi:hypothetical protein